MGDEEDPHAFLDIFLATVRACAWPEEEWRVRLLPLLKGKAQRAALNLPAASRVRFEILKITGAKLRSMRLGKEDRPFPFCQRLQEAATRWLQPEEGEGRLLDELVREQFLEAIPKRTANWVRYHRPRDLAAAVTLAEDHLAVHREGQPATPAHGQRERQAKERRAHIPHLNLRDRPYALFPQVPTAVPRTSPAQTAPQMLGLACWRCGRPGHASQGPQQVEVGRVALVAGHSVPSPGIKVTIQGSIYQPMVDSGCGQTMIHQNLYFCVIRQYLS
ncbi:uncharacterized protein LOC133568910 [Nerophis ophidion]|uniref:uncharacterized protein LOC133568910 n=1 Tax=Nerophis ophidion TaxID=159077 RepID=UPI002AE03533|nr:uncharacterized protein LOC133568910 [Nerophis ophidion]